MKKKITIIISTILLGSLFVLNITNSDFKFFEKLIPIYISSKPQSSNNEPEKEPIETAENIKLSSSSDFNSKVAPSEINNNKELKVETRQVTLPEIEDMNYIFSAVGCYLFETGNEYAPYSNEIYYNMLTQIINNCYISFPDKYKKEDSTIILTFDEIQEINSSAFYGRQDIIDFDIPSEYTDLLNYDSRNRTFQTKCIESKNYLTEITSIEEQIGYDIYDVFVTLKKDNVDIATIKFTLSDNLSFCKTDHSNFFYSIINAIILTEK